MGHNIISIDSLNKVCTHPVSQWWSDNGQTPWTAAQIACIHTQQSRGLRPLHGQEHEIDGSVQDCSNSSALALELLQSCIKPSKWSFHKSTQLGAHLVRTKYAPNLHLYICNRTKHAPTPSEIMFKFRGQAHQQRTYTTHQRIRCVTHQIRTCSLQGLQSLSNFSRFSCPIDMKYLMTARHSLSSLQNAKAFFNPSSRSPCEAMLSEQNWAISCQALPQVQKG